MTHNTARLALVSLLLISGMAILGGCPKSENTPPPAKPQNLLGQSVPDKFEQPTVLTVKQGGKMTFTFDVIGATGDAPVAEVTLLLTTNSATSPFGKDNSYVKQNVPIGTGYKFDVSIDPNSAIGSYNVKAGLLPYTNVAPRKPAVQEFTITVQKSDASPAGGK